jgi:NAD(P)-dependent dehydrogenase (short-subunit alcohol dehydrogenase family)
MQLNDKVSVITGAASGIGAACARKFANEGAKLVIVDIDESKSREVATEVGGIAFTCDLNDPSAISNMISEVERTIGPIDLLFNNAGIATGRGPLDTDLEEWQRQWNVNLMSHVHAVRAVLPSMLEREEGYILHTASMAGILSTHDNLPYAVSKHAVVGLAEWLAFTYMHRGIKVGLLAPLAVRTPMLGSQADSEWANQAGGPIKEADEVAEQVFDSIVNERFLILTDQIANKWMQQKTSDPDRWLDGMNRLQQRLDKASNDEN